MNKITTGHRRPFPGDGLMPVPKKTITHAITINAPPERIWPWLIQMGAGRAGWYSYDWMDNGGRPSSRQINPALQHIDVGDIMPAVPNTNDAFIVREIHPGSALILVVPIQSSNEDPDNLQRMRGPLRVSWALILERISRQKTKLLSRGRVSADWLRPSGNDFSDSRKPFFIERIYGWLARMPWFLMAPIAFTGHYFMESRMLHGIKRRVEMNKQAKA